MTDQPTPASVQITEQRHIIGLLRAAQHAMEMGYDQRLDTIMVYLLEHFDRQAISTARMVEDIEDLDTETTLMELCGPEALAEITYEVDDIATWLRLGETLQRVGGTIADSDQLRAALEEQYGPEKVRAVVRLLTAKTTESLLMIDDLDTAEGITTDHLRAAIADLPDTATVAIGGEIDDWYLPLDPFAIGVGNAGYVAITTAPVNLPDEDKPEAEPEPPRWWNARPTLTLTKVRESLDYLDKLRAEHGLTEPGPVVVLADIDGDTKDLLVIETVADNDGLTLTVRQAGNP